VWHHRRFLLKALKEQQGGGGENAPSLREELAYIRGVIEESTKNYQVLRHVKEPEGG